MHRLKNKVALITGAARGIGKAVAESFIREGAFVIVSDIDDAMGKDVAQKLGSTSEYLHLDVAKEEDWKAALQAILKRHQKIDILVNNAGVTGFDTDRGPQDPEHASLESWRHVHSINADGVFLGCKAALSAMKKTGGSIINMSSRSGLVGIPGAAAYASSKASVRNHTKSVALYAAEKGYPVRCNSLHPAAILTPMWDAMLGEGKEREKAIEEICQTIPMRKMGTVEDVAHACVYLASDESSYITGTELTIDGGILAGASASPKKKN